MKDRKGDDASKTKKRTSTTKDRMKPSVNPFERRMARRKFEVIGKRLKGTEQKLGQSRSRAIEKRKQTLLVELEQEGKSNAFVDRRFGESDPNLTEDAKMLMRFQKVHSKRSKFNLDDEADNFQLTHLGKDLGEDNYNRFQDDYVAEDEDASDRDEEDYDTKPRDFGGMTRVDQREDRTGDGGDNDGQENPRRKTRDEIYREIIVKSKMHRAERAREKEAQEDIVDELDTKFMLLQEALTGMRRESKDSLERDSEEKEEKEEDDYDIIHKQLAFEGRAKPTDRLKTPEELIKEEYDRLQQLEADRLRRMRGEKDPDDVDEAESRNKMPSADALDEGYVLDPIAAMKANGMDAPHKDHHGAEESNDTSESESESSEDEDEEDQAEEDTNDLEDEDAISVLSSDDDEVAEVPKPATSSAKSAAKKDEAPIESIPFVFSLPSSYAEFVSWIDGRSASDVDLIISRIRACNHVKITPQNKDKMIGFEEMLWTRFDAVASPVEGKRSMDELDVLTKYIFELSQEFSEPAASCAKRALEASHRSLVSRLAGKHVTWLKAKQNNGKSESSCFPRLNDLLLLKLISLIFPVTDFQHQVVTPAILYIGEALAHCPVHSPHDIVSGLFLCNLAHIYTKDAGRYLPESISFLTAILTLLSEKQQPGKSSMVVHPSFSTLPRDFLLLKDSKSMATLQPNPTNLALLFSKEGSDRWGSRDQFNLDTLSATLKLLTSFLTTYSSADFCASAMEHLAPMVARLPRVVRAMKFVDDFKRLLESTLVSSVRTRRPLTFQETKVAQLKQFNPRFLEENWTPSSNLRDPDRQRAETRKLQKKMKREEKSAQRELRKDNLFLEGERSKKRRADDAEREEKRKEIMHFLETQQGQTNKLERLRDQLKGKR